MSFSLFIARRYLRPTRRNRFLSFITAVAVAGVALGSAALLIALSILDGFDSTLRTTMVGFLGHIEVSSFGRRPLYGAEEVVRDLPRRVPDVAAVGPYIAREGIVRSKTGLEGVMLKGIAPESDVTRLRSSMVSGRYLGRTAAGDSTALPQLILGERLARRLEIKPGDTVVVFAPEGTASMETPPAIAQFVVVGLYRTGMAEYDDIYTFTTLSGARTLFTMEPGQVSGYDIVVRDPDRIREVQHVLDTALGYPHFPRTVYDIFEGIFAWLDLQRQPIPIVLGLISIVAAFNIVSTLLMMVLEKTESIGVLSALGARPSGVMRVFLGQGLLIGVVGAALGSLLAGGFAWVQSVWHPLRLDASIYFIDTVPVSPALWHYGVVWGATIGFAVIFTTIPALIAARIRPVQALRFR